MAGTQSAFREAFRHGELPAFCVACNATVTWTNAAYTKVPFNVKEFDPDNLFNMNDYTFRPRIAGLYMMIGSLNFSTANTNEGIARLFVNGANSKSGTDIVGGATAGISIMSVSAMVPLQVGDFVDLRGFQNAGVPAVAQGVNTTYFQGYLVRAS